MSVFTYNGVTLPYVIADNFSQEAVYDSQGQTDWIMTKYDITVRSVINTNYLSLVAGDLAAGSTPADIMKVIRSRLLIPRKTLSYTFNGIELIPSKLANNVGSVDAMNGPKPQKCLITQLNNETFLISYQIHAHYWESSVVAGTNQTTASSAGDSVLFNRWSETVDIDHRNLTVYTRTGTFQLRSDNHLPEVPDEARERMAWFGVRPGFRRDKSSYTISPDGLSIRYTIVDRELLRMPPPLDQDIRTVKADGTIEGKIIRARGHCYEADGTYTESTINNGLQAIGAVSLTLKGDKDTEYAALIAAAVNIAINKLKPHQVLVGLTTEEHGNQPGRFTVLEQFSISIKLWEPEVTVQIRCRLHGSVQARLDGVTKYDFQGWTNGFPLEGKPAYHSRGTADVLLKAAAYYDPSLSGHEIEKSIAQLNHGREPCREGALGA